MNNVSVGLIGLGIWGECHLQALLALPEAKVAAICDSNPERLARIGDRYGIALERRYTDSSAMIARADIDLIHVVTFEKDHLAPTLEALRSGKHVLVEKPVSTDVREVREMEQAAKRYGRLLFPGHLLRFDPRYAELYRSVKDGDIGAPISMYMKRAREKSLFGIFQRTHTVYELMVHDIDLAIWYAGSRVEKVRAYGRSFSETGSPEVLWACLEFGNGMLAMLQSNWQTPDEARLAIADTFEIVGSQGVARFETSHGGPQIWNGSGRFTPDYHIHRETNGVVVGSLIEQLRYVCRCVSTGEDGRYASFPDAVHGIEVADAIVRSAASQVDIRLQDQPAEGA